MRKQMIVLLLVAGLVLTLAGCGGGQSRPLRVGMMPITDNLPFWVAQEKDYFQAQGLEVELIPFPSALERDSAFAAGQIDAAIGDLLAVATMNNAGTAVKAVAVGQGVVPGENRFAVLSAPDSGITTPEQLKNVPIALSLNTINQYITEQLLVAQGLNPGEIKFNSMPKLPIRMEALLTGQVQAATLPDPFATLAAINGARVVVDNSQNTVAQTVIIVRQETLDNKLEDLQGLVQAYTRAVEDLQDNPLQYRDLLAQKAQVPDAVLEDPEGRLQLHFSPPVLPDVAGLETTIQWMLEHDLLQQELTCDDLVDGRVLGQ